MSKKRKNFSLVKWNNLSSEQKEERKLVLQVLAEMRSGKFLTRTAKELGVTPYKVKLHLGRTIRKVRRKWRPSKKDNIERSMVINEKGKRSTIIIPSSRTASFIGTYFNAVRNFLQTGDKKVLKPFKNKQIVDSKGKKHKLETRPRRLLDIEERKEDYEFQELYQE